jgi:tetratricopeptide (TPR) repeat protein/mono/diheme cytochrome c family protein
MIGTPKLFSVCLILASAIVANAKQNSPAQKPSATAEKQVTFNRDIAPILFRNCAICHRPGEAGPFPLLTYNDAKSHARQIAKVTRDRFMPPWLPEPNELKFADELRLSEEQIALIQMWYEQGAVEGEPTDLPPAPQFVPGWQLGKPDEIIQAEKPFSVPENGTDAYWNFVFRTPVSSTRWLRAVEIRPGEKRVVHHANILIDRMQNARREEKTPGAGFAGMELKIESEVFDPDSHFLFWKPGTIIRPEPEGMALRLDKNTDLVLNVHLQPSGKPETIQPALGLYFTDRPATLYPILLQLGGDKQLDIPAGEKNFVVTDEFTLPVGVALLAIYPHAHYLGKEMLALASLPNGAVQTLIHIKKWDLNWQAVYTYAKAVALPAGTKISMRYTYDNSKDNLANPNDPPQRVAAGNRSSDEMAHLWLQVLPGTVRKGEIDPRRRLQEAMARHNVGKDPGDFSAQYNLGAMLQARGEMAQAVEHYQLAVRLRPEDATANNALGGALLATGHVDEAILHLSASIKARPDNFDAHYNLGYAFAAQELFDKATEEFRAAARLNPEDANAEANLGGALAAAGKWAESKPHLEHALQLDPHNSLARENLDQVNRALASPQ